MWELISPVNLIRYLIVWRVTGPAVNIPAPACLSMEISQALGQMIAARLPTGRARAWRKALKIERTGLQSAPAGTFDAVWPIPSVIFAYPGKRTYGQGEVILWELKLLGDSADHNLFLEVILPAMEEAATTADPQWRRPRGLWGRFDVQGVYVARGRQWEPVVADGRLDLDYRPGPKQWAEGLTFGRTENPAEHLPELHQLTWLTPFDLGIMPDAPKPARRSRSKKNIAPAEIPTLQGLTDALMARITDLLPGRNRSIDDVWALLSQEEQGALRAAIESVRGQYCVDKYASSGTKCPGRWMGHQTFAQPIPPALLPYLELGSILHLGRHTHFGCGTFWVG